MPFNGRPVDLKKTVATIWSEFPLSKILLFLEYRIPGYRIPEYRIPGEKSYKFTNTSKRKVFESLLKQSLVSTYVTAHLVTI